MDMGEWLPPETRSYLARVSEEVDRSTPRQIARRIKEVTRRGMREKEMVQVGNFICRILVDKEDPEAVRKEVSNFMKKYQRVRYCFD